MKRIFAACFVLAFAGSLRADTIIFKNGEELDGTVVEKDESVVKFEVEKGTILVPMERIRRIDPDTPEKALERERKKQEALDFAQKMKDEGKVLFKGKWMTPEEKRALEDKIAEEKQKKKDAEIAKQKAEADALAKAAAAAAAALAANNNNNKNNNSRNNRYNQNHSNGANDPMNSNGNNNNYGGTILNNSGSTNNGYRNGY